MSIAVVLGAAWGAVVLGGFGRRHPVPARVALLVPEIPSPRRHVDPRVRRLVSAVVTAALTVPLLPMLAPVTGVVAWLMPVLRARRRARAILGELRRTLPEAVDLVALAVGAGLSVGHAVQAVAHRHDGPVGRAFADTAAEAGRGVRLADALDAAAARLGADARPLFAALAASERYGAPLGDALDRLAADGRADRRRRAEEAARRVPVKLLFPLVLCVLPAFGLLTVAPMLAGALGSLRL